MAEADASWPQKHAHELSTISYGTAGIPSYDTTSKSWSFSRPELLIAGHTNDEIARESISGLLKVVSDAETIVEPSNVVVDCLTPLGQLSIDYLPEIAHSPSRIDAQHENQNTLQGPHLAFGSATWLGVDGVDSGQLFVPIAATVTGPGRDTLRLACIGQQQHNLSLESNFPKNIRLPSLTGVTWISCTGDEPILQISFSAAGSDGGGDRFICVRHPSCVRIFEPLLRRDHLVHSADHQRSLLDPNLIITLDMMATGGHPHVDAGFDPQDRHRLAVVDEEGNWSIWKINGRRSTTARVLYKARLKASGKIFSWSHRKRPESIGLYFDGWHKVLWMSSDGDKIDRLLVCNRQSAKLFNLKGEEASSIDPRVDLQKANSFILDARAGPSLNLCLILTTTRVLMFNIAQLDWRDFAGTKGPALICNFQHLHNPADMSLNMTDAFFERSMLLGLFSSTSAQISLRHLTFAATSRGTSTIVSPSWPLLVPVDMSGSHITCITLARPESITGDRGLIQVYLQYKDLSISTFLATTTLDQPEAAVHPSMLIQHPPNRGTHRRSERRVDDSEDEDELTGFVVSDTEEAEKSRLEPSLQYVDNGDVIDRKTKRMTHTAEIVDIVQTQRRVVVNPSRNVIDPMGCIEERLRDPVRSGERSSRCETLLEVLPTGVQVDDVENDSAKLLRTIGGDELQARGTEISPCYQNDARSLIDIYNPLLATFIGALPQNVPDWFRVQKERRDRRTALEQCLSGYFAHQSLVGAHITLKKTQLVVDGSSTTSDATTAQDHLDRLEGRRRLEDRSSTPIPSSHSRSSLADALSRLSCFAKIRIAPQEMSADVLTDADHLESILSHVPVSATTNPNTYDYQAVESSLATEWTKKSGQVADTNGRSRRKTDKVARTQTQGHDANGRFKDTHSGDAEEARKKTHQNGATDLQTRSREYVTMPIRTYGKTDPQASLFEPATSDQQARILSDGHLPIQASSQTSAGHDAFPLTQPERGAFANRSGTKNQGKSKKKTKRVAGF